MKTLRKVIPLQEGHFKRNKYAYIGGTLGILGGPVGIGVGATAGAFLDAHKYEKARIAGKFKTVKEKQDKKPILLKLRDDDEDSRRGKGSSNKTYGESLIETPHSDDELKDAVQKYGHKGTKHRKNLFGIYRSSKVVGLGMARELKPEDEPKVAKERHHMIRAQKAWTIAQGMIAKRRGEGRVKRALWSKHYHPPEGYEKRTTSGPWAKEYDHGEWQDKNPPKHKHDINKSK